MNPLTERFQCPQLGVPKKPKIRRVDLRMSAETAEIVINRRGIQEHGKAMRKAPIDTLFPRVEHVEVILEANGIGLECARINHVRHNPSSFLFGREPAHNRVESIWI